MSVVAQMNLVGRLQAGDRAACDEFFRSHVGAAMAVARRFFRDANDAADAVQDAFLAAFRFIGGFEANASLSTWLHRITVNCCLLKLRSGRRKPFVSLSAPEIAAARCEADPLDRQETRDLVRRCVDGLPPAWKRVIQLRDLDGLDTATTARVLGTSEAVVKTRLHRARHALKRSLETARFEL